MTSSRAVLAALALLVGANLMFCPSTAQEQEVDSPQTICDPSNSTTLGMRQCAAVTLEALEDTLVAVETQIRVLLSDAGQALAGQAGDDWTSFRNAECEALATRHGEGSLAPLYELSCRVELTEQRVAWLRSRVFLVNEHGVAGLAGLPAGVHSWINGLLNDLGVESRARGRFLSGSLVLLAPEAKDRRFLLVGLDTPYGNDDEVVFILFDRALPGARSESLPIGLVYDEYNFGPVSVVDVDADGLLDIVYCTWPSPNPEARIDIVGYDGGWYEIEAVVELDCGLQGSP